MSHRPRVFTMRERDAIIYRTLDDRLGTILPLAMRESCFDMWLVICQEDDLDPVYRTMIPMATWCPILQILIFFDRGPDRGVERINLSMTRTGELYDRPWPGSRYEEQWELLRGIVEERNPKRIGINTGSVAWAGGGLTHNLYQQLVATLSKKYVERLESAEPMAIRWLETLSAGEIELFEHVVDVGTSLIADTFSRRVIVPGQTTLDDLMWHYWQGAADMGMDVSFKPGFYLFRRDQERARHGDDDTVLRWGDFVRCDVGVTYLRLNSDHQRWVYVSRPGESTAPEGMCRLMAEGNRLQDIYMAGFEQGLTGNELLSRILARAREEGIPGAKVYSHSLGHYLHEPGPLIGLPWEQERCAGRGDVRLEYDTAYTMELSVEDTVPEWGGQCVRFALEEDVVYRPDGCAVVGQRQRSFYVV